ncbi:hypothetical protein [Candidatus Nanohalococcus occultus]|uniref:UDP-N-acetylglucosamine--dolichyl-phosphate N-acetylglucosaminephosphotransferase n=1 Tax=Candidatus Nanohalococcus occultus TaxID=2978047 RepID=A0ABY8CFP5_9ARCH|nr:UDP-N-acetylglucosamine--dolichyl-phosphate N-acetylglucosaminephosphotransferase [Candidatus Nanohaloarchaeota archaeon SVXNc]
MIELVPSLLIGFLTVLIGAPYAKTYLLASGIFGVDQQKEDKPWIPTSGGVLVLFGFIFSVTSFLGVSSLLNIPLNDAGVLAALSSVTLIALIGLLDDIHVNIELIVKEELDIKTEEVEFDFLQQFESELPHQKASKYFQTMVTKKESADTMVREGLGQTPKMIFVLPAVFPLIAVSAGSTEMILPFIGYFDWGIFYPLVLLPIGLLFVSNVVNMLAGTNGLAASLSMVAATALGIRALMASNLEAALIGLSLAACLAAFLYYNLYPASFLPGDSLTYLCGAALFSTMVLGNMEKFGVFIFTPWITEFFLKARGGFKPHSWGILQEDRSLKPQHEKTYSLTHPLMRRGYTEPQITRILTGLEVLICGLALYLASTGLL